MKLRLVVGLCISILTTAAAFAGPIGLVNTTGQSIIAMGGNVTVYFVSSTADFTDDLFLSSPSGAFSGLIFRNHTAVPGQSVMVGNFAAGTELTFRMNVQNTADDFFTGPASRNPADDAGLQHAHAATQTWTADALVPVNGVFVQFEDLRNGPFVFNDLDFVFANVMAAPAGIPEPGSLILVGFGAALIVITKRRSALRSSK